MKKQNLKKMIWTLLIVAGMALGLTLGMNWQKWFGNQPAQSSLAEVDKDAEDWQGKKEQEKEAVKEADSIAIPGYDKIQLAADEEVQAVNLHNPERNTCYFKLSLLLPDGTKLWESKLIEPGKAIYELNLNQTLAAAEYPDAVLKYECFALDDQRPLNGSEIKLTLQVV